MSMVSRIQIVYIYYLCLFLNQTGHFKTFYFLHIIYCHSHILLDFSSWCRLHKVVHLTYINMKLRYWSKGVNFMGWTVNISARVSSLTTPFSFCIYSLCCVSFLYPLNHRLILHCPDFFLLCPSILWPWISYLYIHRLYLIHIYNQRGSEILPS